MSPEPDPDFDPAEEPPWDYQSELSTPSTDHCDQPVEMPSPKAPMQVARAVVDRQHVDADGVLTLRSWRGASYRWAGSRWVEIENRTVRSDLYRQLEHASYSEEGKSKPWAPNRYKIADVVDALSAITHTEAHTSPPAWLRHDRSDPPAGEVVAVANGLLHVPTLELRPHTPRFWNHVAVPFDYMPYAPAPSLWLRFLDDLWPEDPDAIAALQEFFGYVISGDTRRHKIMFIVGPLRSGKGTIARLLTALVGHANMTGPTLASLGTNFGLQDLIGKTLAVVSDARLGHTNASVVVERLLSISGEDTLTIDRKYRDPWTGKLGARFLIISNELPHFGDASGAIASRFVVLTLAKSWLGQENHELTTELTTELPGILNWSLQGLARLRDNGRFTEPESSKDAVVALSDLVSPVSAFVRERCIVGPDHEIAVEDLYGAWRSWCEEQGRDRPGSAAAFGKQLRATAPAVRRTRPGPNENRVYRYLGIKLDPQWRGPRTYQDVDAGVPAAETQNRRSDGPVLVRPSESPLSSLLDPACAECGVDTTDLRPLHGQLLCPPCRVRHYNAADYDLPADAVHGAGG